MKRKILIHTIIVCLMVLWSCETSNRNPDKSNKVVSVADLAIQSKLENVDPGGAVDSTWVQTLVALHNIDQRVCILAAESEAQVSEFVGGEVRGQGNRPGSVRIMNSCCPCNGACCGCVDYDFAASSDDVVGLTLTSESNADKPIKAKREPLADGKISAFKFEASQVPDGTYTMTIQRDTTNNASGIQFKIAFKGAKWSIRRGGHQ